MFILRTFLLFTLLIYNQDSSNTSEQNSSYIIVEEFSDLINWENFRFSGDRNPTQFRIKIESNMTYLKINSQNSASGLIFKDQYNPNEYPILSWRWYVENIIPEADGKEKSGDDYAIRIFVMFDDDSVDTSFWTSIRNSAIKLVYGTDPPESSLCFVWANINYEEKFFDSPYSETVKIIPMEMGKGQLKEWCHYAVNIVFLFEEIYNRSCPSSARIALMSDTDNTESKTQAYLDYIQIGKN